MRGYKAFEKGLICRGKQYKENTVFEEEEAVICNSGMHFCENPLDTLDYYPLIDENGDLTEFAEVEPLDEVKTDDNRKYCTKKLKIGAKLNLSEFIETGINVLFKKTEYKKGINKTESGGCSKLAASGDHSKLAASGGCSKLVTSGDYSKLAASGSYSKLAASGNYSQLAASGNNSQLAASGDYSKIAVKGKNSVAAAIGVGNVIKGVVGTWITLAEYEHINNEYVCKCVKSAQIDGEILKADTWYKLENGEFKEVE